MAGIRIPTLISHWSFTHFSLDGTVLEETAYIPGRGQFQSSIERGLKKKTWTLPAQNCFNFFNFCTIFDHLLAISGLSTFGGHFWLFIGLRILLAIFWQLSSFVFLKGIFWPLLASWHFPVTFLPLWVSIVLVSSLTLLWGHFNPGTSRCHLYPAGHF